MSSTTTATQTASAVPMRNPKDSMKSTWRKDPKQWGYAHKSFERTMVMPKLDGKKPPVHAKTEKVPHVPDWQSHVWVLVHAFVPLAIHQAFITYTGRTLHPIFAYVFYHLCFQYTGIHQIQQMVRIGSVYGYLDGDKHDRDEVPDVGVTKVFIALASTSIFRSLMAIMLSYRRSVEPIGMNWAILPIEVGLYPIILDFWFYWYHRVMHQFDSLWKYHRTHHLTKHPNPLLTLYADHEQEIFDIVGIPLLAYGTMKLMGLPMGFYEWWVCQQYVVFSELAGHSGMRIHANPPNPFSMILEYFGAELAIEDHDLHHRTGWKKSHNYGKQTRVWDRLFGTCTDRIETPHSNIDYENTATIFVDMPFCPVKSDQ